MRRYLRLIGCILFFVGVLSKGMSQIIPSTDKTKQVYQLSGIVVGQKSGQPVPYARIRINQTRRGMIADEKGFYSLL
jgi:seryl-tRNA(Sec) selenium transferase